jgi:iron-sulfur cluster assembly protein
VLGPSPIRLPDHDQEEQVMLAVTDPAKELLRDVDVPGEDVLRLDPQDDGRLTIVAGPPRMDDQVVEQQGEDVLHIAGPVSRELDGHSLDRVETPEGPRLTILRPDDDGVLPGARA